MWKREDIKVSRKTAGKAENYVRLSHRKTKKQFIEHFILNILAKID